MVKLIKINMTGEHYKAGRDVPSFAMPLRRTTDPECRLPSCLIDPENTAESCSKSGENSSTTSS
jgi:hypothetical protein